MASSSSASSMAAFGEATTKPSSTIHVPLEGVMVLRSVVVDSTGGDHISVALEPLEEETDSHKGEYRGSDISERDIKEMISEGYLPATEGLVWRAALAGEVTPYPQVEEKV